jgi:hypothetical protein
MNVDGATMKYLSLMESRKGVVMAAMNDNLTVPSFIVTVRGMLRDGDLSSNDRADRCDLLRKFLPSSTVA